MSEGAIELALASIREQISRYQSGDINEQNTRAILIEPLLSALGWNLLDLSEVHREYRHQSSDNPVDYALLDQGEPCLFVEAKALGRNLDERKWNGQVIGYASVAGVQWVVLTDGNEYRVFNAHAGVPVEEKLFSIVHVTDESSQTTSTLRLLSPDGLRKDLLNEKWLAEVDHRRVQLIDHQVQAALEGLLNPEQPDASLVRFLDRRIDGLEASDIKESIGRMRVRMNFPSTPDQHSSPDIPVTELPPKPRLPTVQAGGSSILLKHLAAGGILDRPLSVNATYKRTHLTARIEVDGTMTFEKQSFSSPSAAANAARLTAGFGGRKKVRTNGWVFWKFLDTDNKQKPIDVLRKRYLERYKS